MLIIWLEKNILTETKWTMFSEHFKSTANVMHCTQKNIITAQLNTKRCQVDVTFTSGLAWKTIVDIITIKIFRRD